MKTWTPDLVIALVIILSCVGLMVAGIDGEVKSILAMASGWVFKSTFGKIKEKKNGN